MLAGDDAAVQQELTRRINPDIIFSCELAGDASSTVSDLIEVSHLGQPFVKAGDDFMGLPVVVLQQLERGPSGGHKASIVRTSKSVASVPVHIRTHATIAVSGSVSLRDALTQIRQLLQEQIAQLTSLLAHTASSMESDADLCAAWSSTAAPCLTAQYAQFFPFADGKAAADLTGTYATTHWPDCPIALPFILVATRTAGDSGSPVRVVPVEDNAFAQAQRRAMHHELGLALDRPLFRVACAVLHQQPGWAKQTARGGGDEEEGGGIKGPVLRNVHRGMPGSSVEGGRVHTVQGDYEYYHYMQHGFNDRGWGCAYRSLQTVLSWFRLNQYTTAETPSHEQVQRVLVGIQDKPPSFVGSKQWIGSQEVGYVLDELAGVTSKFIFVSSGAELGTVARQLREHFETQGTPVMMGGGQLAYTILGIDYNEDTGEVEFIILVRCHTQGGLDGHVELR